MGNKSNMGKNLKFAIVFLCCLLAGNFVEGVDEDVYKECMEPDSALVSVGNTGTTPATAKPSASGSQAAPSTDPDPSMVALPVGSDEDTGEPIQSALFQKCHPPEGLNYRPDAVVYRKCKQDVQITPRPRCETYKKCVTANKPAPLPPVIRTGIIHSTIFKKCRKISSTIFYKCHPAVGLNYKPNGKVYRKCKDEIQIPHQGKQTPRSNTYKTCVADKKQPVFKSKFFRKCRKIISAFFSKCFPRGEGQRAYKKCHTNAREKKAKEVHDKCHRDKRGKYSERIYKECHAAKPIKPEAAFNKCKHLGPQHHPSDQQYQQDDEGRHDEGDLPPAHKDPPAYVDNKPPPAYKRKAYVAVTKEKCNKGIWLRIKCYANKARAHWSLIKRAVVAVKTAVHAVFRNDDKYHQDDEGRYKEETEKKINEPIKYEDEGTPPKKHPGGGTPSEKHPGGEIPSGPDGDEMNY